MLTTLFKQQYVGQKSPHWLNYILDCLIAGCNHLFKCADGDWFYQKLHNYVVRKGSFHWNKGNCISDNKQQFILVHLYDIVWLSRAAYFFSWSGGSCIMQLAEMCPFWRYPQCISFLWHYKPLFPVPSRILSQGSEWWSSHPCALWV